MGRLQSPCLTEMEKELEEPGSGTAIWKQGRV